MTYPDIFLQEGGRSFFSVDQTPFPVIAVATMKFCHQHWRCLWERISFATPKSSFQLKMSAPSRSHSSARGEEDYFEWRANIER